MQTRVLTGARLHRIVFSRGRNTREGFCGVTNRSDPGRLFGTDWHSR